jgi:hypothetical protein
MAWFVIIPDGGTCFGHGFHFARYVVPIEKFDRVVMGMTENQVRLTMGDPVRVRHDTQDTTAFS